MMETIKYIVDTSVINQLVNGTIHVDELPKDGTFVASHIQLDEINRTKNERRRSELLQKFSEIIHVEVPTDTIVFGVSKFGKAKFGDERSYEVLKAELDVRNGGKKNNCEDALILEMAMRDGCVLLTADFDMYQVANLHPIAYFYWTSGRFQGPTV